MENKETILKINSFLQKEGSVYSFYSQMMFNAKYGEPTDCKKIIDLTFNKLSSVPFLIRNALSCSLRLYPSDREYVKDCIRRSLQYNYADVTPLCIYLSSLINGEFDKNTIQNIFPSSYLKPNSVIPNFDIAKFLLLLVLSNKEVENLNRSVHFSKYTKLVNDPHYKHWIGLSNPYWK